MLSSDLPTGSAHGFPSGEFDILAGQGSIDYQVFFLSFFSIKMPRGAFCFVLFCFKLPHTLVGPFLLSLWATARKQISQPQDLGSRLSSYPLFSVGRWQGFFLDPEGLLVLTGDPTSVQLRNGDPGAQGKDGPFAAREFHLLQVFIKRIASMPLTCLYTKMCQSLLGFVILFGKWGGGLGSKRLHRFKQRSTEIIP